MLTTKGSALISGEPFEVDMTMMTIKAIRGFYDHKKQLVSPGQVVALPSYLATEACASGKAIRYTEPVTPAEPGTVGLSGRATLKRGASHVDTSGK